MFLKLTFSISSYRFQVLLKLHRIGFNLLWSDVFFSVNSDNVYHKFHVVKTEKTAFEDYFQDISFCDICLYDMLFASDKGDVIMENIPIFG